MVAHLMEHVPAMKSERSDSSFLCGIDVRPDQYATESPYRMDQWGWLSGKIFLGSRLAEVFSLDIPFHRTPKASPIPRYVIAFNRLSFAWPSQNSEPFISLWEIRIAFDFSCLPQVTALVRGDQTECLSER